jgi:hypothetical protein
MLLAAWKRDRAALTVAAVALVGFLLETATSILGLQVQPRYLAYVSVGLAVLAGYAVAHVSGFRRSAGMAGRCLAAAAAALLLWFALSVPVRIAGIEATRGQLRGHAAVIAQLQALSDQPATLKSLRSCRHMTAEWAYLATILGYTAYVPAASMPANWSLPSGRSVALLVEANVPAHWPQRLIPTGFQQRGAVSDFALYTRDC